MMISEPTLSETFITPIWPAPSQVRAFVTSRQGGVSQSPYHHFNLASQVGDTVVAVAENRARLAALLPEMPQWLNQVHGAHVVEFGASRSADGLAADACFSRQPRRVCAIQTADCLPVLLCDRSASVVAAAHAGWRGLLGGIIDCSVAAMNVAPAEILVWLGPAIGPQAFEVGGDVRDAFIAANSEDGNCFVALPTPGKYLADLYQLARQRLRRQGITEVYGGDFCTLTDAQRFFSYRRQAQCGRMASCIWLAG